MFGTSVRPELRELGEGAGAETTFVLLEMDVLVVPVQLGLGREGRRTKTIARFLTAANIPSNQPFDEVVDPQMSF